MRELVQKYRWPASTLLVALALGCLWLWQPERQVLRHHQNFIAAAENRSWKRFGDFIDESYSDRWRHDKAFLVRETSEVLRQFISLTIETEVVSWEVGEGRGEVAAKLRLSGNGTPIAQFAIDEVNALRKPFTFEWQRKSWKPWDWALVSADQPELRVRGDF